tara:strand:- start:1068 stop:1238 length:171 start_codon:yes stop_codon:yes gene_type:complete
MRSLLLSTAAATLTFGTVAIAVTVPATDTNRGPIAAFILASTFLAQPALLIAAAQD